MRGSDLPGYSPRRYEGVRPSENGPRNFGRSGPYHSMAARVICLPCTTQRGICAPHITMQWPGQSVSDLFPSTNQRRKA